MYQFQKEYLGGGTKNIKILAKFCFMVEIKGGFTIIDVCFKVKNTPSPDFGAFWPNL